MRKPLAEELIAAAQALASAVDQLEFGPPVACRYNPLRYAWRVHRAYLERYGGTRKRVIFLGMNPGPFGMAQTGVPFGEVKAVRGWLFLNEPVGKPAVENIKRPVLGWDCTRSEVSGRRLWGLFARRFGTAERFFTEHFVVNYCPLLFLSETGSNCTPDKLRASELKPLLGACDEHLRRVVQILAPEWLIGIGRFAQERAESALGKGGLRIGGMLHPSPANPAANRNWEECVTEQLQALGVWGKGLP